MKGKPIVWVTAFLGAVVVTSFAAYRILVVHEPVGTEKMVYDVLSKGSTNITSQPSLYIISTAGYATCTSSQEIIPTATDSEVKTRLVNLKKQLQEIGALTSSSYFSDPYENLILTTNSGEDIHVQYWPGTTAPKILVSTSRPASDLELFVARLTGQKIIEVKNIHGDPPVTSSKP